MSVAVKLASRALFQDFNIQDADADVSVNGGGGGGGEK